MGIKLDFMLVIMLDIKLEMVLKIIINIMKKNIQIEISKTQLKLTNANMNIHLT